MSPSERDRLQAIVASAVLNDDEFRNIVVSQCTDNGTAFTGLYGAIISAGLHFQKCSRPVDAVALASELINGNEALVNENVIPVIMRLLETRASMKDAIGAAIMLELILPTVCAGGTG